MEYLYTIENCNNCKKAEETLKKLSIEYKTVSIDNPLLEWATAQILGKLTAPFLIKPDGQVYFLAEISPDEFAFVRLLASNNLPTNPNV